MGAVCMDLALFPALGCAASVYIPHRFSAIPYEHIYYTMRRYSYQHAHTKTSVAWSTGDVCFPFLALTLEHLDAAMQAGSPFWEGVSIWGVGIGYTGQAVQNGAGAAGYESYSSVAIGTLGSPVHTVSLALFFFLCSLSG